MPKISEIVIKLKKGLIFLYQSYRFLMVAEGGFEPSTYRV